MISRFQVLLPFDLQVPADETFDPWRFERDGYEVMVHPPALAAADPADFGVSPRRALVQAMEGVRPTSERPAIPSITFDKREVVGANLLVIDFRRASFERSLEGPLDDPPLELAWEIANDVLLRLRFSGRAYTIKELVPGRVPMRFDYLADDGSPPPPEPGTAASRVLAATSVAYSIVHDEIWRHARDLPSGARKTWDGLLLDAVAYLPEPAPSIVLAFAALEGFADWCLRELAARGAMDSALYDWIADRGGDHARAPSVSDQYDQLLAALAGHSLKEDQRLWGLFSDIKRVRNAIAHGQPATLGGQVVTWETAARLVGGAQQIVAWVEALLPEDLRRPLPTATHTIENVVMVSAPPAPVPDSAPQDDIPSADPSLAPILELIDRNADVALGHVARALVESLLAIPGVVLRIQKSKHEPSYFQVRHVDRRQVMAYVQPRLSHMAVLYRLPIDHDTRGLPTTRYVGPRVRLSAMADLPVALDLVREAIAHNAD